MRLHLLRELKAKFGEYEPRSGGEYGFDCPKCDRGNGKRHLGVNIYKLVFHCFKCGWAGHLFSLGFKVRGDGKGSLHLVRENQLYQISELRIPEFELITKKDLDARRFLKKRGISFQRAVEMGCGLSEHPRFWNRVIIPIFEEGVLVSYNARALHPSMEPKEICPHKTESALKRSEVVYGLDELQAHSVVVLVEGIFDAERVNKWAGPVPDPRSAIRTYRAVAVNGSSLSDTQLGKLLSKQPRAFFVMLDGDEAGRCGTDKMVRKITHRFRGKVVKVTVPEGRDPDELSDGDLDKLLCNVV